MKLYKRLLSLLLVCVLLLGAFSTTVNASNDFDLTSINWSIAVRLNDGTVKMPFDGMFSLTNLTHFTHRVEDSRVLEFPQHLRILYSTATDNFNTRVSTIIVPKGDGFSLELHNLRDRIIYYNSSGAEISSRYRTSFNPSAFYVVLYASDNSYQVVYPDTKTYSLSGNRLNFSLSINEVPFDVVKFFVCFEEPTFPFGGTRPDSYSSWARQFTFDAQSTHTIKKIPEEKGLLKSIISWLSGIKSGITDLFNSIADLPNKIINGLKSLFVPSEDYFDNYGDRWDELLSSRFGAVYEVGNIAVEFAKSLLTSMKGNMSSTIDFPTVSIPVGDNTYFDFGGWSVPIQVQGLSFLYAASRTIFAVVGTLLFLKGMRRKYDEIMGVET